MLIFHCYEYALNLKHTHVCVCVSIICSHFGVGVKFKLDSTQVESTRCLALVFGAARADTDLLQLAKPQHSGPFYPNCSH